MELIAIAAIIALAALAGGKKKASDSSFQDQSTNGNGSKRAELKPLVPDHGKASGNPPNISADPAGYNTMRWPDSQSACMGGGALGYAFAPDCAVVKANAEFDKTVVRQFQRDYNKIALHPGWGGIKGTLAVDGIVGKNTFNAMEAAELMGYPWQAIVAGLPPP